MHRNMGSCKLQASQSTLPSGPTWKLKVRSMTCARKHKYKKYILLFVPITQLDGTKYSFKCVSKHNMYDTSEITKFFIRLVSRDPIRQLYPVNYYDIGLVRDCMGYNVRIE